MRDANFFYDLGFENGYSNESHSYSDNHYYVAGRLAGQQFRNQVLSLRPSIERQDDGSKSVIFKRCLKDG